MNARRAAGVVALVSGLGLLVAIATSAFVPGAVGMTSFRTMPFAPGGPMGPGMMGPGHMGWPAGTAGAAIPGAGEVRVTATDFRFAPDEIELPANAAVNLRLENRGATLHDLTVPALGLHLVAPAGQTRTLGTRGLPAGRYPAFCSVPGHADLGMRAVLVVR